MSRPRWPCPFCQHEQRFFALVCPRCESLPWGPKEERRREGPRPPLPYEAGRAGQILPAGAAIEMKTGGLLRLKTRLSTPTGFLGTLERRFFGRADWLGTDGHEWQISPAGFFSRVSLLRDGDQPLAAAEPQFLRGIFHGGLYRLWQGTSRHTLRRRGLFSHLYALDTEEGEPVVTLRSGLFTPVHRVEIVNAVALPTLVLAIFLTARMRQTES